MRLVLQSMIVVAILWWIRFSSAEEPIRFTRHVEPIFLQRCIGCHGPKKQSSGLRLDQRSNLLRGGDSGIPAIVPGDPEASYLLAVVRGKDPDLRMPPEGDLLSAAEIAHLKRWIVSGASWPGQMDANPKKVTSVHWSLQPLVRPQVPNTAVDVGNNPIDAFIRRKLSEEGLEASPRADAVTLIRRATLDLTGLPPTPAEVDTFLRAASTDKIAFRQLVDRLLASPRYGERWAQHWLDVIRWAETVGFETNRPRPNAWPYRDWVIGALNADLPYDRFVFEQIAGDTAGQDAALGFLVAGPANLPGQIGRDEEAMRQARQDELDEVIRTVSQSMLGLSVGCARCHNHKFDPILQRDYYSLQAVFAGLAYGDRRLRGPENDAWTSRVPELEEQLKTQRDDLEALRRQHGLRPPLDRVHTDSFRPIQARAVRMQIEHTATAAPASLYEFEARTAVDGENVALARHGAVPSASSFALANQTRHFDNLIDGNVDTRQAFPWVSATPGPAWIRIDFRQVEELESVTWHSGSSIPVEYQIQILPPESATWHTVARTNDRLPRNDDQRSAAQVHLTGVSAAEIQTLVDKIASIRETEHELARLATGPQVYAASFSPRPTDTWLLRRGDPMQRGSKVEPGVPLVLGELGLSRDAPESERRLALARHLIHPQHPLTARVIVNRVWQHHFGVGLVDTPSDLGLIGSRPSHPELLDWLALDLIESGWSLKHLHSLIVRSEAYQQISRSREAALRVDADSRWLWRFPPRRLEAESIRDSILFLSAKLDLRMGGPGFDFFDQRGGLSDYTPKETFDGDGWRRMIYAHKIRMQSVDIFGAFDCPDAGQMRPRRTRSITPLQSLSLWNSPFTNRHAAFFADRVRIESGSSPKAQVDLAFRLAFSRYPTTTEQDRILGLLQNHGLEQVCRVLINTSEFVFLR